MEIDLIESWPRHLDYPLHRQFLHQNRHRFKKVIIVFTNMNVPDHDYRIFIQEAMKHDDIIFLDSEPVRGDQDWRDVAVNQALKHSTSEWVWFCEQDFMPQKGFWEDVEALREYANILGFFQESRLHPCCIFVPRKVIDMTSRNFGVVRDVSDHFSVFQRDIEDLTVKHDDITMGMLDNTKAIHLNGLSQNLHMLQSGQEPNYNPKVFKKYCQDSLKVAPLPPDFQQLLETYTKRGGQ